MKTIQLYLNGEGCPEPKLVEVSAEATIADVINKYREVANLHDAKVDEIELFFEDEEQPKNKGHHIEQAGIKKRHRVHCHRCRKVAVTVEYNGQIKVLSVPPSATGAMILKKAAKEFNISEKDAADLILKLPNGNVLQKTDHIGSFVASPHCEIKLLLIHNTQVQG
ncbi:MAG: hypothetical protein IT233_07500 [Bacteroidia bacterium]|nr:hypothetical protein [Bacteroidia bacterium]